MKHLKKAFALLLVAMMVLALGTSAFAQTAQPTAGADADGATITISNASNGETYKIAKLFDATVTGTNDGSIAYQGNIPDSLSAYFTKDSAGNISATSALDLSNADVQAALTTWAEANVTAQAVSDGSELKFTGLPYGYYIITTTQGESLLTVDSTNPNASVIDKNTTPPINNATKTADDDDVFIGQTVTYTISFDTANYSTEHDDESKQIVKYIIKDDFADGVLTGINVTSIKVIDGEDETALTVQQFDSNGKIEIAWVDASGKSLYPNGAKLEITYTATVADTAAIDGEGNKNTVTLNYEDEDGEGSPSEHKTDKTIYTYAVAIKKVNQSGNALAGATFELPFYVKKDAASDGAYVYAFETLPATFADGDSAANYTNSLTTPDTGLIIIKGVQQGTYSFTETEAPNGYNKLTAPVSVDAEQLSATTTSTTTYLDKDGNIVATEAADGSTVTVSIDDISAKSVVVVNKTGAELPSTGGIGTTIFYVVGGILVLAAGVVLITRKRVSKEN